MYTPFDVQHGHAGDVRRARAHVLTAAYAATPERFVNKQAEPLPLPGIAWIPGWAVRAGKSIINPPTSSHNQLNEPAENMTQLG